MTVENISWSISSKECCRPRRGSNPRPPGLQSDAHPTEPPRPALYDKTYNRTCVTSRDSDQPVHPSSTARVSFTTLWVAWRLYKAHEISKDSDQTVLMHSLIWVFAGHTSFIVGFCRVLAHMFYYSLLAETILKSTPLPAADSGSFIREFTSSEGTDWIRLPYLLYIFRHTRLNK